MVANESMLLIWMEPFQRWNYYRSILNHLHTYIQYVDRNIDPDGIHDPSFDKIIRQTLRYVASNMCLKKKKVIQNGYQDVLKGM